MFQLSLPMQKLFQLSECVTINVGIALKKSSLLFFFCKHNVETVLIYFSVRIVLALNKKILKGCKELPQKIFDMLYAFVHICQQRAEKKEEEK